MYRKIMARYLMKIGALKEFTLKEFTMPPDRNLPRFLGICRGLLGEYKLLKSGDSSLDDILKRIYEQIVTNKKTTLVDCVVSIKDVIPFDAGLDPLISKVLEAINRRTENKDGIGGSHSQEIYKIIEDFFRKEDERLNKEEARLNDEMSDLEHEDELRDIESAKREADLDDLYPESKNLRTGTKIAWDQAILDLKKLREDSEWVSRQKDLDEEKYENRLVNKVGQIFRMFYRSGTPSKNVPPGAVKEMNLSIEYLRGKGRVIDPKNPNPALWISERGGGPRSGVSKPKKETRRANYF